MIKAPKWCKDAVPVKAGWSDARTGELLKVQNFSHEEIAEWHGAKNPAPAPEPAPVVEDVEEPEDD
jgi:hypothetical protein